MLQVGERIEGHFVLFQEIVDLKLGLKPQQLPDILRGQDARPKAIQHKTFQNMPGDVFPLCLDTLRNIIRQMNSDFHKPLLQINVISLCTIAGNRPHGNAGVTRIQEKAG
jgi:hypothetical protein